MTNQNKPQASQAQTAPSTPHDGGAVRDQNSASQGGASSQQSTKNRPGLEGTPTSSVENTSEEKKSTNS